LNPKRYFQIQAVTTPGASAASYVPIVIVSRGLAFIRLLIVARLLGAAGKAEFGLYQPALEVINWIVPLVLFGLADIGERYASHFEREGRLRWWLQRQLLRLLATGSGVALLLLLLSPWIATKLLEVAPTDHTRGFALVAGCAATILLLALYQHLAAVLRGIRAFAASAGMELLSSTLLLLLCALAAWRGGAVSLIYAYAASILITFLFYAFVLWRFLQTIPQSSTPAETPAPAHFWFGTWTFLRLLLVMTFGLISVVGIGHLAPPGPPAAAHDLTADYAMPYRVAQLLAYVAVTLWASTYGIAARAWTHGQVRRAEVQMLRVGKWGAVLLTLIAVAVLLLRGILAHLEADYAAPLLTLLPPLLGIFLWYGLLNFWSLYGDLHERPWLGATLWGTAILIQLAGLFLHLGGPDPAQIMIVSSATGLAVSLFLLLPLLLWHPFRFSATAVPMAVLSLAPLALFSPSWVVDGLAIPILLGAIAFLYVSGLLIRPLDRRAWRRWRAARALRPPAAASLPQQ
jgi:O-antigen/teichoic acid export membrane protein